MDRGKVDKLLGRQRDRVIASLLDFKERECDEYLPDEVARALRKVILDQVNDLTNFCTDLLDDGVVFNDVFIEMLSAIHQATVGAS